MGSSMTLRPNPRDRRLAGGIVGFLLVFAGIGYFVLLAVALTVFGPWTGHLEVPAFMFGFGVLLIWAGHSFLKPKRATGPRANPGLDLDLIFVKYRRIPELFAVAGCGLTLACAAAGSVGMRWPSRVPLWILIGGPVGIGLLSTRILVALPLRSVPFTGNPSSRWPSGVRFAARTALRVGWFGYFAVFFFAFDIASLVPDHWRLAAQIAAFSLTALLYASQAVELHFGNVRQLGLGPDSHE